MISSSTTGGGGVVSDTGPTLLTSEGRAGDPANLFAAGAVLAPQLAANVSPLFV